MRNIGGNYTLNLKQRQKDIKKPRTRIIQKKINKKMHIRDCRHIHKHQNIRDNNGNTKSTKTKTRKLN
jgi:hypothetical protein